MCLKRLWGCSYAFVIKYFLAFSWLIFNFLFFCKIFKWYNSEPEYYYLRKLLGATLCISRATVPIINMALVLIMLPVNRTFNQIVHNILGKCSIKYLCFYLEKVKIFHMTLSIGLVMVSVIHSAAHVVNIYKFIKNFNPNFFDLNWAASNKDLIHRLLFATPTGFSGCAMLLILIIMWLFSTRRMRDRFFNSFLSVHHVFIVLLCLMYFHPLGHIIKFQTNLEEHYPGCEINNSTCRESPTFSHGNRMSWIWPTIPLSIFIIDGLVRYLKRNNSTVYVIENSIIVGEAIFLKLKMNKHFVVRPGQFILLQCENISSIEWHPFTVTQCPHDADNLFTITISVRGDWTRELYEKMFLCNFVEKRFLVDGPFPSPMESILKYDRVICVAAGIGITPFISVLNELLISNSLKPKRLHLIWICRDLEQFLWFSDVLAKLHEKFWMENKPDRFEIQLYLTNKNFSNKEMTTYFKYQNSFLNSRIFSGRPIWQKLFSEWIYLYKRKSITVYSCGPKALNHELRSMCCNANKNNQQFTFVHEAFN